MTLQLAYSSDQNTCHGVRKLYFGVGKVCVKLNMNLQLSSTFTQYIIVSFEKIMVIASVIISNICVGNE